MVRLVLGILKGGIVAGLLGYLASRVGLGAGTLGLVLYGVLGAIAGIVCGRPFWRQDTIWTPVLKALVGFGVGLGLAVMSRKVLGDVKLPIAAIPGAMDHPLVDVPALLGTAIGAVYGAFVEVDDAGSKGSKSGGGKAATKG